MCRLESAVRLPQMSAAMDVPWRDAELKALYCVVCNVWVREWDYEHHLRQPRHRKNKPIYEFRKRTLLRRYFHAMASVAAEARGAPCALPAPSAPCALL